MSGRRKIIPRGENGKIREEMGNCEGNGKSSKDSNEISGNNGEL